MGAFQVFDADDRRDSRPEQSRRKDTPIHESLDGEAVDSQSSCGA